MFCLEIVIVVILIFEVVLNVVLDIISYVVFNIILEAVLESDKDIYLKLSLELCSWLSFMILLLSCGQIM